MELREFLEEEGYCLSDCITALDVTDTELLEEVHDNEIKDYASNYLDLIEVEDCDCGKSLEFATAEELWDAFRYLNKHGNQIPPHAESMEFLVVLNRLIELEGYYPFRDKFEEFLEKF